MLAEHIGIKDSSLIAVNIRLFSDLKFYTTEQQILLQLTLTGCEQ